MLEHLLEARGGLAILHIELFHCEKGNCLGMRWVFGVPQIITPVASFTSTSLGIMARIFFFLIIICYSNSFSLDCEVSQTKNKGSNFLLAVRMPVCHSIGYSKVKSFTAKGHISKAACTLGYTFQLGQSSN